MNSESFHRQPLPFHAPPPAPAFTFIYCAVTVNAPADRFQEDSSDLADVLFRLLYHCARWRLVAFVCRLRRRRAACGRVRVRACRGFCPTFSLYCAVTVNAPADRFQEDSSDLANVLFRLLHHRARWRSFSVCDSDGRQAAGGSRVRVRACRGFCPTFSAVLSIRSYHSI